MSLKKGEVYYIEKSPLYAARGAEMYAARPGIVVSSDAHNASSMTVEVVYLTTQPKVDRETHVTIRSLDRCSTAICEQIFSVDKSRIGDKLGDVSDMEMMSVDVAIASVFGIGGEPRPDSRQDAQNAALTQERDRLIIERDIYKQQIAALLRR